MLPGRCQSCSTPQVLWPCQTPGETVAMEEMWTRGGLGWSRHPPALRFIVAHLLLLPGSRVCKAPDGGAGPCEGDASPGRPHTPPCFREFHSEGPGKPGQSLNSVKVGWDYLLVIIMHLTSKLGRVIPSLGVGGDVRTCSEQGGQSRGLSHGRWRGGSFHSEALRPGPQPLGACLVGRG